MLRRDDVIIFGFGFVGHLLPISVKASSGFSFDEKNTSATKFTTLIAEQYPMPQT